MESFKSLSVYILVLVALYVSIKHFISRIQNLPPTPYPFFPIIGLLYLLKKPLNRSLTRCSDKHGPVVLFHVGTRRILVVSSPSLVEECLTKNDVIFANRPRLLVGKYIGFNYTTLVWASSGDHLRNLRRISSLHLLSTQRIQMLSNVRVEEVKLMIRFLVRQKQDQIVDMRAIFFELILNGMLRMIVGKRYYDSDKAKRFREIQLETFTLTGTINIADFLPYIMKSVAPRGLEKRLIELQRQREELVQNLIEKHRLEKDATFTAEEKGRTMIEVLLALQEMKPECYTDETIRGLLLVLLLATDSSVHTMEWALSLLLNHPQVLEKARKEIDKVAQNHLLNESDLNNLPYLHNIINETLRMYPPGPILLPHESSKECTVGGYCVPRGTMLLMNIWAIHNDPKIWVDPRQFKPERFEGFEGTKNRFKLLPFGFGRRGCPGEALAMCVVGLALGTLIQCFEWERVSEEMVDMKERGGFTLAKDQPLHAKCRIRPCMIKGLSQI